MSTTVIGTDTGMGVDIGVPLSDSDGDCEIELILECWAGTLSLT